MREILFRAWWKDGGGLVGQNDYVIRPNGTIEFPEGGWDLWGSDDSDLVVLEQFTGLLDNHGRKIFEGDIVVTCPSPLSISDGGDASKRLIVDSWVFTDMCHKAMCRKGSKVEKFYKIVGNVYDNPDLMKES